MESRDYEKLKYNYVKWNEKETIGANRFRGWNPWIENIISTDLALVHFVD